MSLKLNLFNQNCFSLAKSILLKSDLLAKDVEAFLSGTTNAPTTPRSTWKYYLNLTGTYHSTDVLMRITSLDTLAPIDFTKENLQQHPITRQHYKIGTDEFLALLVEYPTNKLLIYGIVYDLAMDTILAADDFTILAHASSYVDAQEIDLIPRLQSFLYSKFNTYLNKDYCLIEPKYNQLMMFNIFQQLPNQILKIRLSNHKTTRACDFYIWEYINNRVYLEDIKDLFNQQDVIYLYKNIDRLISGNGTNKVFNELVNRFLTPNRQNITQLNISQHIQPQEGIDFVDTPLYTEVDLNLGYEDVEVGLTPYIKHGTDTSGFDYENYTDYELDLEARYSKVKDSHVKTRSLKITSSTLAIDSSLSLVYKIDTLSYLGVELGYNASYSIDNHVAKEVYTLTLPEALILYTRVVQMMLSTQTENILSHTTFRVPRNTKPTASYLVETYQISEEDAIYLNSLIPQYPTHQSVTVPEIETFINDSTVGLFELSNQIRKLSNYRNQHLVKSIDCEYFHAPELTLTASGTNYEAWLVSNGINIGTMDMFDLDVLHTHLLSVVFNIDIVEGSVDKFAVSTNTLLSRFTSYKTQLLLDSTLNSGTDHNVPPLYGDVPSDVNHVYKFSSLSTYTIHLHDVVGPMVYDLPLPLGDLPPVLGSSVEPIPYINRIMCLTEMPQEKVMRFNHIIGLQFT